ncbi:hypothetical protein TNCV_561801 [Trichonephila clavipes]|uniref:Uncharacterized protein n=1 Tax=Trichonephila clavipes TaxID=2585209 RepID=A0A8X6VEK9_TRICX|nr:hypothetical protein TNCV_561801 [Trichonephila clavipes]
MISTYISSRSAPTQITKSLKKPWETLVNVGPIPNTPGESRDHRPFSSNFLGVYLRWLDRAADDICPLCDHARTNGNHLVEFTEFEEHTTDGGVSRYRKDLRQRVKKSSTDVG